MLLWADFPVSAWCQILIKVQYSVSHLGGSVHTDSLKFLPGLLPKSASLPLIVLTGRRKGRGRGCQFVTTWLALHPQPGPDPRWGLHLSPLMPEKQGNCSLITFIRDSTRISNLQSKIFTLKILGGHSLTGLSFLLVPDTSVADRGWSQVFIYLLGFQQHFNFLSTQSFFQPSLPSQRLTGCWRPWCCPSELLRQHRFPFLLPDQPHISGPRNPLGRKLLMLQIARGRMI